ncbi:hypothetical protein GA0070558_13439 [Micromonospora haikouensis]|uniref:HTH araC/xylS-type domain-containing protein n=1 Tax=Micromonospora haikouensis TaxID=686309 RepID=A0A1C4Y434_9ACTN|nr:hypothetical protein GA0070558_13439 [Micromonospora haikouensis]
MTPEKVSYALQLLAEPDRSMASIATLLGVSRATLFYKALPELTLRLPSPTAGGQHDQLLTAAPSPPG